jgi:hypothetical protein
MIMQPELVTGEMFIEALAQLRRKKGDQPAFTRLRLECFNEGQSAQTIHIGPYASEPATIERMHAFMLENELRAQVWLGGRCHRSTCTSSRMATALLTT